MSKDLMNELASKLGGQQAPKRSYRDIIDEINNADLNALQLQKKLDEETSAMATQANSLEESSKFKDAAILYFEIGIIVKEVNDKSSTDHHTWIEKSSKCLVLLSNEYIAWGVKEIDRAAASLAIGNLINFLTGNWTLLDAYNEFNSKYADQIQQGNTAAQSLWVPYDLVNSVTQLNSESLQRAENYAQTALLTQVEPAKSFHDAVQTVIANAREAMVSQMKLPNVDITGSLPKDIIFGENFTLNLDITNTGEGFANDVKVVIDKLEGLNLVQGSFSVSFKELEANSKTQKLNLEFNCPSGEGDKEKLFEIKGKVEYLDILENKRINPIGPYPILIRTFKKADELKERLKKIENSNKEIIEKFDNFSSDQDTTKSLINSFNKTFKKIKEDSVQQINDGEFIKAETRLELLNTFLQSMASPAAELILTHDDLAKETEKIKNSVMDSNKKILEQVSNTESILDAFEKKWKK